MTTQQQTIFKMGFIHTVSVKMAIANYLNEMPYTPSTTRAVASLIKCLIFAFSNRSLEDVYLSTDTLDEAYSRLTNGKSEVEVLAYLQSEPTRTQF